MLRYLLTSVVALICVQAGWAAETVLPAGSAPAALELPHFPDRLHAFVWRNWNVVESARLAKVLETSAENVRALAESMGLPAEDSAATGHMGRIYLSVIRRNWQLLPYEQLLTLLDMSADRLAYVLREDDFLWVKLGGLKPKCARLVYAPPDAATARRAAEIKALLRREFGEELGRKGEERFGFLQRLSHPIAQPRPLAAADQEGLRFLYSYFAVYGDSLSDPSLDPYPDELLQKLADVGVNGVWLHVVLRDMAPSKDFPEFGAGHERRLESLRKLVQRARRFGVRVYLYMNEPRAMPAAFFKDRQEMAGVREGDYVTMCTSNANVRRWLEDSLAYVFENVPDLGGVFTISASENLTNCASHYNFKGCPHCKERSGPAIIVEANAAIEAGVHRGNPRARVIAWDWGWPDDWAAEIIAGLPKSVWFQSVSEWSLPLNRGGVKASVGEYSLSAVGPGPRATRHWGLAKKAGLKCVAKMQVNNTWELSAVPYLPVMDLVAEHAGNLRAAGIDGMMLSWSLGGYPSPNLQVVRRMSQPGATKDDVLGAMARERFGEGGATHARKAWRLFSDALREYPFDGGVIYNCPVQVGPANLLYAKPTGYAATMVGFPYDDVDRWRGPYPAETLAGQFEKVAAGWRAGLLEMELAVNAAPPPQVEEARGELRLARAALLHFQSVANQTRFVLARSAIGRQRIAQAERQAALEHVRQLLQDEQRNARELFTLTREDSRIGFEASNHYYYLPQDLMEKVINCEHLLRTYAGEGN
jgi:hypothetical protein